MGVGAFVENLRTGWQLRHSCVTLLMSLSTEAAVLSLSFPWCGGEPGSMKGPLMDRMTTPRSAIRTEMEGLVHSRCSINMNSGCYCCGYCHMQVCY